MGQDRTGTPGGMAPLLSRPFLGWRSLSPLAVSPPPVAPSPTDTPFPWRVVTLSLSPSSFPPGPPSPSWCSQCHLWVDLPLSSSPPQGHSCYDPLFSAGGPRFGPGGQAALTARGPRSLGAVLSGRHAPSPEPAAIGRAGHVLPPRPAAAGLPAAWRERGGRLRRVRVWQSTERDGAGSRFGA